MCSRLVVLFHFYSTFSTSNKRILGQTTLVPNYFCDQNSDSVEFTLSPLSHSAWKPASNCSLDECVLSFHNNSCRSSTTPCFDYRTLNNTRYCAPGILCSILEACNSTTSTCTSDDLVCVINSCCSPQAVCIPASWTSFCALGNKIVYIDEYDPILCTSLMHFFVFECTTPNDVFYVSLFAWNNQSF